MTLPRPSPELTTPKSHIARKPHRCDTCGRLIAIGTRYWRKYSVEEQVDFREHTNCEDFKSARELPFGFNQDGTKL